MTSAAEATCFPALLGQLLNGTASRIQTTRNDTILKGWIVNLGEGLWRERPKSVPSA